MTDQPRAVESSPDAIIVDRGYRKYEGLRTGPRGTMLAIVKDGFRRVTGLRRKARRKVLPWFLIILALTTMVILVGIHWATSNTPADLANLPKNGEYFDIISVIALLFSALAIPELLVPDRSQGTLNVYFSRPLTVDRYLAAKALAIVTVLMTFYLVPQFLFHLGLAAVSNEGFLSYLGGNLDVLWKVPTVALVYVAVHGAVASTIAAFLPRVGAAAGVFLGSMLIFNLIAAFFQGATDFPGARYASLFAFEQHPRVVRDWIFGIDTVDYLPTRAGFEPGVSLAMAALLVLIAAIAVRWQYRRSV
ncbi:MAG TPA: hypothetical protein ENH15_04025 [Actinobacteria bacterium]|nr:hypothetical protein [Actinomycetota bacterium]